MIKAENMAADIPNFKKKYMEQVVPALKKDLGVSNPMRLPRLSKIVVNMGIGIADKAVLQQCVDDLANITGQRPVITKARKSISNFKLRQGADIGARVTLRGNRMYEYLERLIHAALPRIRDFRGLSATAFDGRGNYTVGITEQTIFPEINPDKVSQSQGMNITIVTTAKSDDEARLLLKKMGFPFAETRADQGGVSANKEK